MESRQRENVAKQRCIPKEVVDIVREYKAMHEENFLSSWLKGDVEGMEDRRTDRKEKAKEDKAEVVKERWREKRRKRLLSKEGVSTLFLVTILRNSVRGGFG